MHATIWGCRGSLASPGPETVAFGGNTSCVEVELADGTLLILDAGTGIRKLGLHLYGKQRQRLNLLLTHLHLDHLEGLGFFRPLWDADTELVVWGPPSQRWSLQERIERYLSPPLFPVELKDAPAQLTFHDVPEEPWTIGGARITAVPVAHPGPTVAYRIEGDGFVLAYIPDHEPAMGGDLHERSKDWLSGFAAAEAATLLLHDAQYTADEYRRRVGWGHSSVDDAVAFGRLAGARELVLFHHDPFHSDSDLRHLEAHARELWGEDGAGPALARESTTIAVG